MCKRELENLLGHKMSAENYEAAEIVYLYHPACEYKEDIACLWKMGGRALIEELKPRALKIKAAEERQSWLRGEMEENESQLAQLRKGGGDA